jgi:hypothetical protein
MRGICPRKRRVQAVTVRKAARCALQLWLRRNVQTLDNRAFRVLGIEPTNDGRAIRAAFLRLARIYHPDRFAGQPDDVRAEAERRMKQATVAYEALRGTRQKSAARRAPIDDKDLQERARAVREILEAKQVEEKRNQARWQRWRELELQARARAEIEASIVAAVAEGDTGFFRAPVDLRDDDETPSPKRAMPVSAFSQRLDAARRGQTAPIARREPTPD